MPICLCIVRGCLLTARKDSNSCETDCPAALKILTIKPLMGKVCQTLVKRVSFCLTLSGFEFWLQHLLAVVPGAGIL